jgi:hypothetical protein
MFYICAQSRMVVLRAIPRTGTVVIFAILNYLRTVVMYPGRYSVGKTCQITFLIDDLDMFFTESFK